MDYMVRYPFYVVEDGETVRLLTARDAEMQYIEWGRTWDGERYRVTQLGQDIFLYYGLGAVKIGESRRGLAFETLYKMGKKELEKIRKIRKI